jgi:hypothetical protein
VLESIEQCSSRADPAHDDDVSLRGRAALESYVQDVLFNPSNRDGSRFRGEFLAWRDPSARDFLRQELLNAAASWSPEAAGWEKREGPEAVTFSGRMGELKATLTFVRGAEPRIDLDLE